MVKENKLLLFKNIIFKINWWLKRKNKLFSAITPFVIGIYFVSICLIYYLSIQTFISIPSFVIFVIKGVSFILSTLYFVLYLISQGVSLDRRLIALFFMIYLTSFIAIILNPFSREITSVARITVNNDLYYGWVYNSTKEIISISLQEKLTAVLTLTTFVLSAFLFTCVFPNVFKNSKSREIVFIIIGIAITLFIIYSLVIERNEILEIIRNKFDSKKGIKSIFDNKNTFGLICFFGLLLSTILLAEKKKIVFGIIFLIFSLGGVIITVCKTAIMSVGILVILLSICTTIFILKKKNIALKIVVISLWTVVIIGILLVFILPQLNIVRESIFKIFVEYGSTTIVSRTEAWRTVFQTVNGHNILIGFGDSIYMRYFVASTEAIRYWGINPYLSAHNSLLEIYLIGGIFRLSSYVILLLYLFKIVFKNKGFKKFVLLSAFISFMVCSTFETIILCDHTTLSFVPSLLFVSYIFALRNEIQGNNKILFKRHNLGNTVKNYFKTNLGSVFTITGILFFSILAGYFVYYKNYWLSLLFLVIVIISLVLKIAKFNTAIPKDVFAINIWLSICFCSFSIFLIYIFDKDNSFFIGFPFSFEENKYKDVVSVYYLGGYYPFLISTISLLLVIFGSILFKKKTIKKTFEYFEIKL